MIYVGRIFIGKANDDNGFFEKESSHMLTRNVCITKYARLYKLSNGIMVMTPK
jgi:hypothetical protein